MSSQSFNFNLIDLTKIEIENKNDTLPLEKYYLYYELTNLYGAVESNSLLIDINPKEKKIFNYEIKDNCSLNSPYYISFYILYNNQVVSYKQYKIKEEEKLTYHKDLDLIDDENHFIINGVNSKYLINKKTGNLDNVNNHLIMELSPSLLLKNDPLINTSSKAIEFINNEEKYIISRIYYRTSDDRLSIRYTINLKDDLVDSIGFKFKINQELFKILYFGNGPLDSHSRFLKGIESFYQTELDSVESRTDIRIMSILNKENHGLRFEYADVPFIFRNISNTLYLELINNNYDILRDNSEYSFEIIVDSL